MTARRWLQASSVLNVALVAIVVAQWRQRSAPGTDLIPQAVRERPGEREQIERPTAVRAEAHSLERIPAKEAEPAGGDDARGPTRDETAAHASALIDSKWLRLLPFELAVGNPSAAEKLPSVELRSRVAGALQPTDVDFTDAEAFWTKARSELVAQKIERGEYQKSGGSFSGEGERVGCYLPDGTPITLILRPGESCRLDDARARWTKLHDARVETVRTLLETWNAEHATGK